MVSRQAMHIQGGNVTGIEFTLKGLTGKQLEFAREIIPQTSTVGLLVNMKAASNPPQRRDAEAAANVLGIKLIPLDVHLPDQLGTAFQTYARERRRLGCSFGGRIIRE